MVTYDEWREKTTSRERPAVVSIPLLAYIRIRFISIAPRRSSLSVETVSFYVAAFVALVSAVLMVTRRNPMHGALLLILNFFALSVLYLTLSAQFIAIVQILVYAGAIMVLVLFVIMLLNLQNERNLTERRGWIQYIALAFAGGMFVLLARPILLWGEATQPVASPAAHAIGTAEAIGQALYTRFFFPFELASILLLAAIVGAVVLAKKRFP
jgi:NADH-quinone oxidoreductase subunit J